MNQRIRRKANDFLPLLLTGGLFIFSIWALLWPGLPLTQMRLDRERRAIEELNRKIDSTAAENRKVVGELSRLWRMRATAMNQTEPSGMVLFRERVESAAAAAGLRSRTSGNVRRLDLIGNAIFFEVSFSADGQTAEIVAFLAALVNEQPRVYWRTLTIKPAPGSSGLLNITGTLCALNFIPADAGTAAAVPVVPATQPGEDSGE